MPGAGRLLESRMIVINQQKDNHIEIRNATYNSPFCIDTHSKYGSNNTNSLFLYSSTGYDS